MRRRIGRSQPKRKGCGVGCVVPFLRGCQGRWEARAADRGERIGGTCEVRKVWREGRRVLGLTRHGGFLGSCAFHLHGKSLAFGMSLISLCY